ncbi:hypothetical protein CEXT_375761 [Caerostris extrusa]|uniref:Uncharacterized protein n=1 Tax=Caerostris extrusa TaxID=172846 RepID=A0AAV4QM70_CAEEX|nr:hypothetical protein CEXT_375761 [Caerostris extrusa]
MVESFIDYCTLTGVKFENRVLSVVFIVFTLADNTEKETKVEKTQVNSKIEGRLFLIDLFSFPTAKNSRTPLGNYILCKANIT